MEALPTRRASDVERRAWRWSAKPTATSSGAAQRPAAQYAKAADPTPTPSATPTGKAPSILDAALPSTKGQDLDETLQWAASPPEAWQNKFATFTCPEAGVLQPVDDPEQPLVTCDEDNTASRLVIEHNGGILEDVRQGKLRYWVPTS